MVSQRFGSGQRIKINLCCNTGRLTSARGFFCPAQISASPCIIECTVSNQDAFAVILKRHLKIILVFFVLFPFPKFIYRQSLSFPIPCLLFGDSLPLHDGTSYVPSQFVLWICIRYRLLPRRPPIRFQYFNYRPRPRLLAYLLIPKVFPVIRQSMSFILSLLKTFVTNKPTSCS